jgi:predicted patatin/cPLA2 family phospholipase
MKDDSENRNERRITDIALVLEGGGMRGLYTTGVLDCFLDHGLYFDNVIGVSAGACHALSYISRQRDRSRRVNVDYCRRPDYLGLSCLIKEKSLFGMDLIFRRIPFELDPFDVEAFNNNLGTFIAVATNLKTGEADYLSAQNAAEAFPAIQASSSLPVVTPPFPIHGELYLDGGVADSIPVRYALAAGYKKVLAILTQPDGYRKDLKDHRNFYRVAYRPYPQFVEALARRNWRYNETLDLIKAEEKTGRVLTIRPQPQPGLSRLERDPKRLNGLYKSGYADGLSFLAAQSL